MDSVETQIALARLEEQFRSHVTDTTKRFDRQDVILAAVAKNVQTLVLRHERWSAQKKLIMKVAAVVGPLLVAAHQAWGWVSELMKARH